MKPKTHFMGQEMANSTNPQTSLQELLEIQLGIAQAISEVPDPLAILDHMLDNLKAIHGVDAVGVYFQSGEDGKFVLTNEISVYHDPSDGDEGKYRHINAGNLQKCR